MFTGSILNRCNDAHIYDSVSIMAYEPVLARMSRPAAPWACPMYRMNETDLMNIIDLNVYIETDGRIHTYI
jgi:hypothetical protein